MEVSAFGFGDVLGPPHIVLDPSRIAAQVVSGIGFLGAGTIIIQRHIVKGLTTAASVWAVAAVGLAVGGGMYVAAACATALTLLILAGVKPLERHLYHPSPVLTLVVDRRATSLFSLLSAIERSGAALERLVILPGATPDEDRVEVKLRHAHGQRLLSVIENLRAIPGVQEIRSSLDGPGAPQHIDDEDEDDDEDANR
jgi:putative Mg2+ transporter-C (MgtC) family protein